MFSPRLSHQEQVWREEPTSESQATEWGRLFSMFLAEIGLSTSLPVFLLPVRPVAEEMLNPRNTSADLGRARAGRMLPLCWGCFLQIQNKEIKEM